MGYMTTITILNDAWDQIQKHPEQFIENIGMGINGIDKFNTRRKCINSYGIGDHCNPMEVARSNHADDARLYLVYQNSMIMLGYGNEIKDVKLRESLLETVKWIIKDEEREIQKLKNNITKS